MTGALSGISTCDPCVTVCPPLPAFTVMSPLPMSYSAARADMGRLARSSSARSIDTIFFPFMCKNSFFVLIDRLDSFLTGVAVKVYQKAPHEPSPLPAGVNPYTQSFYLTMREFSRIFKNLFPCVSVKLLFSTLQTFGRLVLWEAMFLLELHSAETQDRFSKKQPKMLKRKNNTLVFPCILYYNGVINLINKYQLPRLIYTVRRKILWHM